MKYKVGDTFWIATLNSWRDGNHVETASVKVVKITPQFFFVDKSELLFGCTKRFARYSYDGGDRIYHTTKKEALYAVLNRRAKAMEVAKIDILLLQAAIAEAR